MNRNVIKKGIVLFILAVGLLLLIIQSQSAIESARGALLLCYQTIIPSLFPFFVLSKIFIDGGFASICAKIFSPVTKSLFGISGAASLPFLLGILSGYPTGAKSVMSLYESEQITKGEVKRLLPICNNAGPLFIVGAVGCVMLRQPSLGIYLYVVHVVSAFISAFIQRFFFRTKLGCSGAIKTREQGILQLFSAAVTDSVFTILTVCGFVVFFAVFITCISPILDSILPANVSLICKGLLEVTNGAYLLVSYITSPRILLTMLSAIIGFGGICVMMQVVTITKGIGLKQYVLGKLLQGVVSATVLYISYPYCQMHFLPVVSVSTGSFSGSYMTTLPSSASAIPVFLLFVFVALRIKSKAKKQSKKVNQV